MPCLCRDCLTTFEDADRCPACGRPRIVRHDELLDLTIAHMDCDAFFASVEKRDNPALRDKPVIIGGGQRGVVSTACYVARIQGVRSAMPMFKALKLCPDAVVIRGNMARYAEVSRQVRALMHELTPAIEPLSVDEAFLDLSGTARLHGAPAAVMLARLTKRMQDEIGITGSIGLSHNKFLAKIASDLDKPRGFSVIGRAETQAFLDPKPVNIIWGIGPSMSRSLDRAGIRTIRDLRRWDRDELIARFGSHGLRLWHLCRGEDHRSVKNRRPVRSVSHETTFNTDTCDLDVLDGHLWRLSEKAAARAKAKAVIGGVVMLKLKRSDHSSLTRRVTLAEPTQLADTLYRHARPMLERAMPEGPFRLIGVGLSDLHPFGGQDSLGDLLDPDAAQRGAVERTSDEIRARFGDKAIIKGRALR